MSKASKLLCPKCKQPTWYPDGYGGRYCDSCNHRELEFGIPAELLA